MIYIGTSLTEDYLISSFPYFDSLKKHASDLKCFVICVDFEVKERCREKWPSIDFLTLNSSTLKTVKEGWPENREKFICLESGEFLDLMPFEEDDIIIFTDTDMYMQRAISDVEKNSMMSFDDQTIGMFYDELPVAGLAPEDDSEPILEAPSEKIREAFDGDLKSMARLNSGVVIAKAACWEKIREYYLGYFDRVTDIIKHHSAGQWMLNWISYRFLTPHILSPLIHNGHWLFGTESYYDGNYLKVDGEIVLLAHKHKYFNRKRRIYEKAQSFLYSLNF